MEKYTIHLQAVGVTIIKLSVRTAVPCIGMGVEVESPLSQAIKVNTTIIVTNNFFIILL